MIFLTDIRPDEAFANMLKNKIFAEDFDGGEQFLIDEQLAELTEEEIESLKPVAIYAYGDKPLSGNNGAFIELRANGVISSDLRSMEGASGMMLISLYTPLVSGIVDSYLESHILRQLEYRLRIQPMLEGYYFELNINNAVFNGTNSVSGYHDKGFNVKWNLTNQKL